MSAETTTTVPGPFKVSARGPAGEDRGELEITADKLDDRVRYRLLRDAVLMYQANRRVGTHSTRTRSDVAGSNKKPWRQKGTGRARSGTRKSPLWRGGGVVFGPHPRSYRYAINKKQRRLAVRSALLSKFADGQVVVLEGLELEAPRTSVVASALRALGVDGRCLIGTAEPDRNWALSSRNLPRVTVRPVADFNAYEILGATTVVLTRPAFDLLQSGGLQPGASELATASAPTAGRDDTGDDSVADAGSEQGHES